MQISAVKGGNAAVDVRHCQHGGKNYCPSYPPIRPPLVSRLTHISNLGTLINHILSGLTFTPPTELISLSSLHVFTCLPALYSAYAHQTEAKN